MDILFSLACGQLKVLSTAIEIPTTNQLRMLAAYIDGCYTGFTSVDICIPQ